LVKTNQCTSSTAIYGYQLEKVTAREAVLLKDRKMEVIDVFKKKARGGHIDAKLPLTCQPR
jgi:hypothetical protein